MSAMFIHLRVHSEYSIEDSIVRIPKLSEQTQTQRAPALAITDVCNVFAAVKFYRATMAKGIKPIIGAELRVLANAEQLTAYTLVLLCQDKIGYQNLCLLISRAYQEGQVQGVPHIQIDWLKGYTDGLICLSGGVANRFGSGITT